MGWTVEFCFRFLLLYMTNDKTCTSRFWWQRKQVNKSNALFITICWFNISVWSTRNMKYSIRRSDNQYFDSPYESTTTHRNFLSVCSPLILRFGSRLATASNVYFFFITESLWQPRVPNEVNIQILPETFFATRRNGSPKKIDLRSLFSTIACRIMGSVG